MDSFLSHRPFYLFNMPGSRRDARLWLQKAADLDSKKISQVNPLVMICDRFFPANRFRSFLPIGRLLVEPPQEVAQILSVILRVGRINRSQFFGDGLRHLLSVFRTQPVMGIA